MKGVAGLIADLADALGAVYPVRLSELGKRPGVVTCIIVPTVGDYDAPKLNGAQEVQLEVEVHVMAAGLGEQAVADLLAHLDPVASLIRTAGWVPRRWRGGTDMSLPEIVVTAVAGGIG